MRDPSVPAPERNALPWHSHSGCAGHRATCSVILAPMRLPVAVCALFLLAAATPARAQDCSQAHLERLAAHVTASQQKLLTAVVQATDEGVPPAAQLEIPVLKDSLAMTVDLYVKCLEDAQPNLSKIQNDLAGLLGANTSGQRPGAVYPALTDNVYGAELKLTASNLGDRSNLIVIKASFDVECGVDTLLLLYEQSGGRWARALRWQSGPYDVVSGAFGDYVNYVLVPQGSQGGWVLAAVHGDPWCSSVWSGFGLDVIEPARDAAPQRSLFHLHSGYNRRGDFGLPTMKPTADGFELRVISDSIDTGSARSEIFRYRVSGDEVRRIQPVAVNGRDFVDEWLQRDWSEARDWTAAPHIADLEKQHAQILADHDDISHPVEMTYGPVRACSDDPHRFQVELDREEDGGPPIYFAISEGQNSFTMLSASPAPDPHCTGADLMPRRH